MSTSISIKISVSPMEAEIIDGAVNDGDGKNRADVCRKALILYLAKKTIPEISA